MANDPHMEELAEDHRTIVQEELDILRRVQARIAREAEQAHGEIENLDAQLIELRDAIGEAKEEDVASLVDQMHQVAALSRKRGQGRSVPIDPNNPYFGHLRLKDAVRGRARDVLIGKHTLLDDGDGVSVVDWRNAPVSRLYYRYEEGDAYEEEFDERVLEGDVLLRRSLAVSSAELRRVSAPQGTFARDGKGVWREALGSAQPTLQGGAGSAARVPRGKLGVNADDDQPRADKHLQEITALIDKQQFELITHADSGVVLIQGGAGSGKTTVALHRVAYLNFNDPRRFAPGKMVVVVFNDALVEYIRHVLPALGVEGVQVTTYRRWTAELVRRLRLKVPPSRTSSVPEPVARFKKHPVVLKMLDRIADTQVATVRSNLVERVGSQAGGDEVLKLWDDAANLPPAVRAERVLTRLQQRRTLPPKTRAAAETELRRAADQLGDYLGDWLEFNTDGGALRAALAEHAPEEFSTTEVDSIVRWCARKAALDDFDEQDPEDRVDDVFLDPEDDAIVLRLMQLKLGGIFVGKRRFEYEHIVIDEAQDLCPLEVRVLLETSSEGRSVTIAGDRAQKMIFDNGFTDWPQLLEDAGLPHVAIQPLKITYRSTRQIMAFSRHVLGPLHDPSDDLIARDGAEVSYFQYSEVGEAVAFLGDALRELMRREPNASVALISRYPQQSDVYYEALRVAEVPKLRRVRREDFSFSPGIDVTDIRQVKGLEFDYVVLLDPTRQNYPEVVEARHLMHIGATRAAFQLWLVCAGQPSPLIDPELIAHAYGNQ